MRHHTIHATNAILFFISTLFLFVSCREAQKKPTDLILPVASSNAGIGLIHFNPNHPILLYQSESEVKPFDSIQFLIEPKGRNKGQYNFVTQQLKNHLQPYLIDKGDSDGDGEDHRQMGLIRFAPQLVFRVIKKSDNGVVVVVNEKTNETAFIKIDPSNDYRKDTRDTSGFFDPNFVDTKIANWYYFETWEQAIQRAYLINIPKNTLVYDKPNGNTIGIQDKELGLFRADTVQNEWVCLTNKSFLGEGEKENKVWLRWKENEEIKIGLTLNGGYE